MKNLEISFLLFVGVFLGVIFSSLDVVQKNLPFFLKAPRQYETKTVPLDFYKNIDDRIVKDLLKKKMFKTVTLKEIIKVESVYDNRINVYVAVNESILKMRYDYVISDKGEYVWFLDGVEIK